MSGYFAKGIMCKLITNETRFDVIKRVGSSPADHQVRGVVDAVDAGARRAASLAPMFLLPYVINSNETQILQPVIFDGSVNMSNFITTQIGQFWQ